MFRFILLLLGKDIELCKSCETLKQQLEIANINNKELTETLLSLLRPKIVEAPERIVTPLQPTLVGTWGRKRALLEEQERLKAKIARESHHIGKADIVSDKPIEHIQQNESVEKLEQELGVTENSEIKESTNVS